MAMAPFTEAAPAGAQEQPIGRLGLLESLRRHVVLLLVPVVLLVAGAVAYGLNRTPEYTSEARVNVGGLNLTDQSIPGYTTAVQQLSVAYARSIDAAAVVDPVARKLGMTPNDVLDRISATPVQGSAVLRIRATGTDATTARRLADAATDSLIAYALELNAGRGTSEVLLARFQQASRDFQNARSQLARAPARGSARERLETRTDIARLEMQTAGFLYQQSQAGQATTNIVQKLTPGGRATSDRDAMLKDLIAGALIAGLLIGVGLAVARENALARRRTAAR
jgi:capsular polysaccharide biosynthesis protein